MFVLCSLFFFFFKQKTAYEMRISDWSSDVCSSDLHRCVDTLCACHRVSDVPCRGPVRRKDHQARLTSPQVWSRLRCYTERLASSTPATRRTPKIGRASCRERVCQYV